MSTLNHIKNPPPHLQPNINDWPINILSDRRDAFKQEIVDESCDVLGKDHEKLVTLLRDAVVHESRRIKSDPWSVDPPNEKSFWNSISKNVRDLEKLPAEDPYRHELALQTLKRILNVYAQEIAGTFKASMFRKARVFCNLFFSVLFNKFFTGRIGFWGGKKYLSDKIRVIGEVDEVRNLFEKGTLVFLPTHSSNLDSLLLGYALDLYVGIPSSHYGAGLNLFNSEIAAYFMNRLGAYRVDRRKKNRVYLEALKSASRIGIRIGVNSLFFTGGTRSRSGEIENNLKLGLLGTAIEAQRMMFNENGEKRVFVVPVVMSYSNVLEDNSLFRNFLVKQGLASLVRKKLRKKSSFLKTLRIFGQIFSKEMSVYISLGKPIDVFGNPVNDEGRSVDRAGKTILKREYFMNDGVISQDVQREMQYTRHLAKVVAQAYQENNVVRLGQIVAKALVIGIEKKHRVNGIQDMLKLAQSELEISRDDFRGYVSSLLEDVKQLAEEGRCLVETTVYEDRPLDKLIDVGISQLRTYQIFKVVAVEKDLAYTDHLGLLVYYANRLNSYEKEFSI